MEKVILIKTSGYIDLLIKKVVIPIFLGWIFLFGLNPGFYSCACKFLVIIITLFANSKKYGFVNILKVMLICILKNC
jgi:hypothetical protein